MKEQSKPRAIAAVPSETKKDSGAEIVRSAVEAAPGSDPLVMGAIELDVPGPPLVAAFHLVHGHY